MLFKNSINSEFSISHIGAISAEKIDLGEYIDFHKNL